MCDKRGNNSASKGKNWYFENDELVITKGSWTIARIDASIIRGETPTQHRRTFNRELDLESGQWEEAIRREERQKVLSEVETICKEVRNECRQSDEEWDKGDECRSVIFKLNQLKGGEMKSPTLEEIIKDMARDQDPGSTYYAWQSNIAMAVYDELNGKITLEEANDCAKRFLGILMITATN